MWLEVPACILIESQTKHIFPPPHTIQPSRRKIQRMREPDKAPKEGRSGTVIYKIFSTPGHNQRTCKSKTKKTTETLVGDSSSQPPIQPHSTFKGSSSQPPNQTQPQSQVLN